MRKRTFNVLKFTCRNILAPQQLPGYEHWIWTTGSKRCTRHDHFGQGNKKSRRQWAKLFSVTYQKRNIPFEKISISSLEEAESIYLNGRELFDFLRSVGEYCKNPIKQTPTLKEQVLGVTHYLDSNVQQNKIINIRWRGCHAMTKLSQLIQFWWEPGHRCRNQKTRGCLLAMLLFVCCVPQ